MRLSSAVAAIASAALARAADHLVQVGANGLSFTPNQLTGVAAGDTVTFEFHPKNHSVTQSTFTDPCQQSVGGANSGYLATAVGATTFSQWQITVDNASAPLWFFCAQVNPAVHCHSGMVFSINANAQKSFEQFQLNANQSTLTFTDAGQPPQPTAANPPPAGQTNPAAGANAPPVGASSPNAPPAGATNPNAPPAGATAPPLAGTISTSVPTNAIPSPAPTLTTGGGVGSGVTPQGAAGQNTLPGSAVKVSVGASGLIGIVIMLTLLL